MHVILRELATSGNSPIYPKIDINEVILSKPLTYYSNDIKGGPWSWIGVNLLILAKMIFCHNLLINIC